MGTRVDVGQRAPSFELRDQSGSTVRSADLLGRGPVIVFFYPRDASPGCTAEACSFRDANHDFAKAGATVIGISSDDVASHKRFADQHQLGFPLLADEGGRVRASFGVEKQMLGLIDGRVTFIIDRDGIVRQRYDSMIRATKHVDEALATVAQLAAV